MRLIASFFLLQRMKGSMSGDKRDFNNIETRAVIKNYFQSNNQWNVVIAAHPATK